MPPKAQKQRQVRFVSDKPMASRNENAGADLAFNKDCQEIREKIRMKEFLMEE